MLAQGMGSMDVARYEKSPTTYCSVKTLPSLTEFTRGGPGGCVDRCGCCSGFNPPEHGLPAVPAMGPGAGCFRGFLPVVVEGD